MLRIIWQDQRGNSWELEQERIIIV